MSNDLALSEKKENTFQNIKAIKKNILFFNKNNFKLNLTNIKKEIRNRSNFIRKCMNIKNTVFEEIILEKNSLVYKELVKNMGKYFFGPNGKVTENYKFLRDYYDKKDINVGSNKKINVGILDYFSLISDANSYTQRLNSTKKQILTSSRNLSVARSKFDLVEQKALSLNKLFNKNKNFVNLNVKNIKRFYMNDGKSTVNVGRNKKLKNNFKDNEKNQINESSYKDTSPKNTILERYSNESIIKELKQKLNNMDPYNFFALTSSYNKLNINETKRKRKRKLLPEINIKQNLIQRIKPIVFLNRNSIIDLSFIRNNIKSKNDKNAIGIIQKKNLADMMFDKSDLSFNKIPNMESITLSKKKEQLKNRREFSF